MPHAWASPGLVPGWHASRQFAVFSAPASARRASRKTGSSAASGARLVFCRGCPLCLISLLLRGWRSEIRVAFRVEEVAREWRNGRRAGFRCQCPKGRGGSNPPSRTQYKEPREIDDFPGFFCFGARADRGGSAARIRPDLPATAAERQLFASVAAPRESSYLSRASRMLGTWVSAHSRNRASGSSSDRHVSVSP
jgi:hypothetical protein